MEETDLTIYNDLIKISKELLIAAKHHELEVLDDLVDERNNKLKFIYPDIVNPSQLSPEKTRLLHELIELNERTIELAVARRQAIAVKIKQIKNAEKANNAYNNYNG